MKSTLPPFHQKWYDIRVQSNFVSAQTAQWELYFQCSFCDKVYLKESIFFLYLKTGFITPDEMVSVTKIEPKYSRVKKFMRCGFHIRVVRLFLWRPLRSVQRICPSIKLIRKILLGHEFTCRRRRNERWPGPRSGAGTGPLRPVRPRQAAGTGSCTRSCCSLPAWTRSLLQQAWTRTSLRRYKNTSATLHEP